MNVYEGQSAALSMDFKIRITVEPGADVEYRSPTYRIGFGNGLVLAE